MRVFGTEVDEAQGGTDCSASDDHAFQKQERITFQQHAVGKGPAVAFIGVADDVLLVGGGIEDGAPFDAGGEAGTAASAKTGFYDRFHDFGGL